MDRVNEFVIQNSLDLNDTVVFEYDIENDVMHFTDNVRKYMPCASSIASYISELSIRGKIHPEDVKKAIRYFKDGNDDTELRVEYLRFLDYSGEYPSYQLKGRVKYEDGEGTRIFYGVMTLCDQTDDKSNGVIANGRDPLTLLDGRETFIAKLNNYFKDIPEDVLPGLMIIDIDDYVYLKSAKGEGVTDTMLHEVAKIIQRALRGADLIGRYSGDHFVVCMKGVHDERIFCERATYIIDSIKSVNMPGFDEHISATIGIAIATKDSERSFDSIYEKCILALESAKALDRGAFCLYSDSLHRAAEYKNVYITGREIELVRSILDPVVSWAYAVDENYNIIYANKALMERLGDVSEGICYSRLKGYTSPCPECPIYGMKDRKATCDCAIYSPSLRCTANVRVTRLVLRNRSRIYIFANVRDDIERQIETLRDSTQRYADAVLSVNEVIWDVNLTTDTCIRLQEEKVLSPEGDRISNYTELRGYFLENVVHPEDREYFIAVTDPEHVREAESMGMSTARKEMRFLVKEGGYKWFSMTTVLGQKNDEGDEIIFISARDINRMRSETIEKYMIDEKYRIMMKQSQYQMEIALNNERYEHVNELTGIYVFEYDVTSADYYICTTFDSIFDINDRMLDNEWSLLEGLVPADEDEEKYRRFLNLVKTEPDTHTTTVRLRTIYNKPIWFTLTVQTLKGMNNALTRVTGILQNVNSEMEIKAELEFRADYDSLTGLFNSEHFYRATRERIHKEQDREFVIISIDVTRFRIINDRFGIDAGNRCLKYLGSLIKKSLEWDDIAGHYQADNFSILLPYKDDQEIYDFMADLGVKFEFEEATKCGSSLSFGVYKIHDRDIPVRLMCDRARFAKREIKGNAFVNYAVYDDKLRLAMREQAEIESEMRLALKNHEFVMYLQPKYDANTEKICGAEALVRWKHPTKGMRMPGDFLPLFEDNGFVRNLDEYMWERAAEYLADLSKRGFHIPISVNLSRIHIHNENLIDILTGLVDKYKIDTSLLELEVTENYFLDDVTELYDCMTRLKEKGFTIEMDDFGSGYSSLNMLRHAPIDVIKIDRFFLDEVMVTSKGKIVVENSIRMSKQLGMKVVAEGVETIDQLEFVRDAGCDIVQGYYFSKPVPIDEFEVLIKNNI